MTTWINNYYDKDFVRRRIEKGNHRGIIGGMWDEVGQLQFDHLVQAGLRPDQRLLDLGCGCLRGGLHFIPYLNPAHYYGIDISQDLMDVGYDVELAQAGLQQRMPRSNLICSDIFDARGFGVTFDVVLAQSVFTHLPLNHLKLCLAQLRDVTAPGALFFATVFDVPADIAWDQPQPHDPGGVVTYPDRDPYHYTRADLDYCCTGLPWRMRSLNTWAHPRDQRMAVFERLSSKKSWYSLPF
mmetsp:Transcript_23988/g.43908  ORF Transcript_23988/g.43908 Transcript_23988/m.43908 type:complete len:240 (+) Transcript_23988:2162-2881(+)